MTSGEEIDYSKFKGQFIRITDVEQEEKILNEKRIERDKEDELAARRYKDRKETLRHKYSPLRRSLSKKESDKYMHKTRK